MNMTNKMAHSRPTTAPPITAEKERKTLIMNQSIMWGTEPTFKTVSHSMISSTCTALDRRKHYPESRFNFQNSRVIVEIHAVVMATVL